MSGAPAKISCVIATFGAVAWADLAFDRARPSALEQGFHSTTCYHGSNGETLAQVRNAAARQEIYEGADGLVFLDADDELAPGYLDGLKPGLTTGTALPPRLLVPYVEYVRDDGWRQEPRIPQKGLFPKLNECVIGTCVSSDLFTAVGGFREWTSLEDYDLWLRCYDAGARLMYCPGAVYVAHYRADGGGRNADQSPYTQIYAEHLERQHALRHGVSPG